MRLMQMAAHRGADEASSLESSDTQSSVPGASRGEKQGLKKCHSQESRSAAPIDFVEGGLRGWMAVLGGAIMSFCTFGVVQAFGVYQDYYTRSSLTEKTASQISWIGSVQVFLLFSVGLPASRLMEAGYYHHTAAAGTLIYSASMFWLSAIKPHQYHQSFLAQGVGTGLGMGMLFLPSYTISSHYFRRRRSLAMGVVVSGASIGGCVYPILLNNMFSRPSGFEWGVRIIACMNLGLLLIANFLLRPRLPERATTGQIAFRKIVTDVPFLIFIVGAFLIFLGVFIPFFYLQLYAVLNGVDIEFAKYAITIMNVGSLFGRTIPALMADRYGPLNVLIASSGLSGALVFAMFSATSIPGVVAFGILYGFCSGGAVSLAAPAVGSFATADDMSDIGTRIGLTSFALGLALLIGNPVAGALLTAERHWQRPLIFAAVVVFAGAGCFLASWRSAVTRRGRKTI